MVKAKTYTVTKRFEGWPKVSDFKITELKLPSLKNGEILVKTELISVDPYLIFDNARNAVPYSQKSFQVGVVQESKNAQFPVGTSVVSHNGWSDYYIADPDAPVSAAREKITKLPDLKGLPKSYAIGAVGMPGASAYLGFLEARPRPGDTVVVTGAAGAVGSIVGQIAKIKGCKVIGFAGSDDKVQWLEKELEFDKALNYKTVDALAALKEAAPNGVDVYFDNVGGEISSSIMRHMNTGGRVCVCGSISSYSDPVLPKVTILQPAILFKELEVKGFIIWSRPYAKWEVAFADIVNWIKSGQLKVKEHVTEGFDKIPEAFIGMLVGENSGKAVVKV